LKKIIILTFILFGLNSYGQIPIAYSFSELQNFPTNTIYNIHEDQNKNIWFGTDEGLYKWNGTELVNFQNKDFSTEYSNIKEDSTGRIWCTNFTGQIFYIKNNALKLFADESFWFGSYLSYLVENFPIIYISSSYGIIEYDFYSKKKKFHRQLNDKKYYTSYSKIIDGDTINFEPIENLVDYKSGFIYKYKNYIYCINKDSIQFLTNYNINQEKEPSIYNINKQLLFFNNDKTTKLKPSLFSYSFKKNSLQKIPLDFENTINPTAIYYDKDKKIFFVGTRTGVIVLDENFKSVYNQVFLEDANVSGFLKDFEGNYWITTLNKGIYIVPSLDLLQIISPEIKNKQIISIVKDTSNQLYFIEELGEIYKYKQNNETKLIGNFNVRTERLSLNPYRNEIYDGNSSKSFNLNTNQLEKNIYGANFKCISFINKDFILSSSSEGSLLKSTSLKNNFNNEIVQTIKKENNFTYNTNDESVLMDVRRKRSYFNSFDYKNTLAYISYVDGFFVYKDGLEKELKYNNKSILLRSMSKINKDVLWLLTNKHELLKVNNQIIEKIDSIDIDAKEILIWKDFLFISSKNGILKYNTKTKEKNWINKLDGLPSNNILDREMVEDILFDKFDLKFNENNLTFYFSANATKSQKHFTYKYRMSGLETQWIKQGSNVNFARYPSIPNGNFTFQVKTINEDNIESKIEEIQISIDAPYYRKWWFFLLILIIVAIIISIYFLIKIRVIENKNKIINEKKEIEKLLSKSQLTALRTQMNPHFIFNALNSIQSFIVNNNKELASDYLALFADLMRKYLDFSNKENISLKEELDTLKTYLQLEKVRFEDDFIYEIKIGKNINLELTEIPVMLIQPFVENAIKHGLLHKKGKRLLNLDFELEENILTISIKDNGIGRKHSAEINKKRNKKHISFATSALNKRIELFNKNRILSKKIQIEYSDLFSKNNIAEGTLVRIVIPLLY